MAEITPELLVRPEIRALSAYPVPDASGMIKLDAMENPYPWPGELLDAWLEVLRRAELNRYPDPAGRALKTRLKAAMSVPNEAEILLGNGSDELIQLIAMMLAQPGRTILAAEPSFVMYRMVAAFLGMNYASVPLQSDDFSLDLEAMLAAIEQHQPVLVFLAYPNNPTGNLFDAEMIEAIIEATPGLVVVDEAYAPFTDASFLPRVMDYNNLVLMRTLSKMGLAGLRLGYLVGSSRWLREIDKLRLPYNINTLTQLSAEFALRHQSVLQQQAKIIRRERAVLSLALSDLPGVTVFASEANFVLLQIPSATDVHGALIEAGILVKNLGGNRGLLKDCLRVTVGSTEQNRVLVQALRRILDNHMR